MNDNPPWMDPERGPVRSDEIDRVWRNVYDVNSGQNTPFTLSELHFRLCQALAQWHQELCRDLTYPRILCQSIENVRLNTRR